MAMSRTPAIVVNPELWSEGVMPRKTMPAETITQARRVAATR